MTVVLMLAPNVTANDKALMISVVTVMFMVVLILSNSVFKRRHWRKVNLWQRQQATLRREAKVARRGLRAKL